jgi:probable phosphoglycerate mutase
MSSSDRDQPDRPTRLVLIRHGESNVTVERVIGGRRTCSGLSALGERQSEALAMRLAETGEIRPDVLASSDFPRALETAEIVRARIAGPAIDVEPDFGEHDPGPEIDGMTFTAYLDRFGTPDWTGDPDAEIFPGGETTRVFHRRVVRALGQILAEREGSTIAVSCHGGVIDAAFRWLLGLSPTGGFELHTVNTSLTEFVSSASGRWRLVRYNDAAHLAGLPTATRTD